MWNEAENSLIEFIPDDYALCYGEHAATYVRQPAPVAFNAAHVMLETTQSIEHWPALPTSMVWYTVFALGLVVHYMRCG
ncbi:hypothetical protein JCM19237_2192 [Photobacterium aphoticum]|uniref:Uncharacterized protein n=1 Tax=Photobacterium aphoticum TaxID=754436 RepID=A0A090QMB7_9GAMM|nr:hypothetical protein JCM19237_2192 [Photobacterium aphoticum]